MFALAVWDRQERQLTCARDRVGIKPLYWARLGNLFVFASELTAMLAHPGFTPRISRNVLACYLRYDYIPAPHTIYEGVYKLPAGCTFTIGASADPSIVKYWDLHQVARLGRSTPLRCSDGEAIDRLEALLKDAVRIRMISDVPLGAFLSGGIDSSTVVALMQCQSDRAVRTFSIGFHDQGYDEATHARAVAAHLRTDHTELYVTPEQARDVIPSLSEWYDEPFADSSQIPTYRCRGSPARV